MTRIITLIVFFGFVSIISAEAAEFAVAITALPVLNTPDFKAVFGGTSGQKLKVDRCGQVRDIEFIALPGSVFSILKKYRSGTSRIYQVETDEYVTPPHVRLFIDGRFIKIERTNPPPRKRSLPPRDEIVSVLRESIGNSYVWGGNVPKGVPELAEWFAKGIKDADKERFELAGLDCSGLLYHATGGWTPRNTSQLITFGQGVDITGKLDSEIVMMLQPLDLIVWNGHVIIVLDQQTTIESKLACSKSGNGGVVIAQLSQRIAEVMRTRRPVNAWPNGTKQQDIFVIRRWFAPL